VGSLTDRLAAKIDTGGEHHCWRGAAGADGTPQIRIDGRLTTVRRVVWEQTHGPLSPGTTVAACPNEPRCVRIDHLSLGRKQRSPIGGAQPAPPTPRRTRRGSGSVRQIRPGVWELSVSAAGTRHYRTVRGSDAEAASALAVFAGEITGRFEDLETLVAAYLNHLDAESRTALTLRRYRQLWRQWLSPTIGTARPAEITPEQLEESLTAMAHAGQSPSSIHQAAVLLSGCLAWAKRQGHLNTNPAYGLRLPNGTTLAPPRQR
jgi:hypothetical protein